jgi:excinuclease UvrABC nuclease subunit
MFEASDTMHYELAAKYRDLRKTVIRLSEQQKIRLLPRRTTTGAATLHDARRKHSRPQGVFLGRLA